MSTPTEADKDLGRRLRAKGVEASDSWVRTQRETGRIPTSRKGQFAGPTHYSDDALEHAAALHAALKKYRSSDRAVLACFWQEFDPKERALRKAYSDWILDVARRALRMIDHPDPGPDPKKVLRELRSLTPKERELAARELANATAHDASRIPAAAGMRQNLAEHGLSRAMAQAFEVLAAIMMGASTQLSQLVDQMVGVPGLSERMADDESQSFLSELRLESLIRTATALKIDDAIQARSMLRAILALFGATDLRPDTAGLWVLTLVLLRRRLGDERIAQAIVEAEATVAEANAGEDDIGPENREEVG